MPMSWQRKKDMTFIHPFDDPAVATGQGTIAMEIVKELPLVDYILVPIGGGGLATGVSTLAKLLNPNIKVYGVEPLGACCMQASLEAGKCSNPSQCQHDCRRHRSKDARRKDLSLSPEESGRYYHSE